MDSQVLNVLPESVRTLEWLEVTAVVSTLSA